MLGSDFSSYLHVVLPHVIRGLTTVEELGVVNAAIGVVTDMCRSLEKGMAPVLDQIVQILLELLAVCC